MRKYVTVTVIAYTDGSVQVNLSDYANDATGVTRATARGVTMPRPVFDELCADHGMSFADFPAGKPVRVYEDA